MLLTWLDKGKQWLARFCFLRRQVSKQSTTSEKGVRGELIAYRYLKRQGYRVVARRYRSRFGEIDLIGWDGNILAFIEVKYRRNSQFGRPEEAVNRSKQRQICRAARDYRKGLRRHTLNYRFDIVGIRGTWEDPEVYVIKDAFKEHHPGRRRF
jgi:putative endonuclease